MFVERLKEENLKFFFGDVYDLYFFIEKESRYDEKHLYCSYETKNEYTVNNRLYDFEGSTVSSETAWRRFMYSLFGEEYKQAYEKYLEEQKEMKLNELGEGFYYSDNQQDTKEQEEKESE